MKTKKIFLPVVAMLSLMLFSFVAHANSNSNFLTENTCISEVATNTEFVILNNSVENIENLDLEDALRIRIRIRLRRVEIIIEIGFLSANGGRSDDGGDISANPLEGNMEGDNLVVTGFSASNGSIIEIHENQFFTTESGAYEVLPGAYEIYDGQAVFNVNQIEQ